MNMIFQRHKILTSHKQNVSNDSYKRNNTVHIKTEVNICFWSYSTLTKHTQKHSRYNYSFLEYSEYKTDSGKDSNRNSFWTHNNPHHGATTTQLNPRFNTTYSPSQILDYIPIKFNLIYYAKTYPDITTITSVPITFEPLRREMSNGLLSWHRNFFLFLSLLKERNV
eukprot:549314_1